MSYDHRLFVNRSSELESFQKLRKHRYQRILLLLGDPGIGKSYVVHRFRRICARTQTLSALVDLNDPELSEPDRVIARIREQIGGTFDEELEREEVNARRYFALQAAEATMGTFVSQSSGAGGGVWISESKIDIGGDIIGRDKIIINISPEVAHPGSGPDRALRKIETLRYAAFRTALINVVAEQPLVLFFDHIEKATKGVVQWFRQQILGVVLEEPENFSKLWIVLAGREVPFPEIHQANHVLRTHRVDLFEDRAVQTYWVEKRGLSQDIVTAIVKLSGRVPQTLSLLANNWEGS